MRPAARVYMIGAVQSRIAATLLYIIQYISFIIFNIITIKKFNHLLCKCQTVMMFGLMPDIFGYRINFFS